MQSLINLGRNFFFLNFVTSQSSFYVNYVSYETNVRKIRCRVMVLWNKYVT